MAGTLVAAAATYLTARLSAIQVPWHDRDAAKLRLSWSARPERIEVCRALSADELAKRAEHMRQRVECTGRFATYQLRVETDGQSIIDTIVHGAGLRNDRPIYLLREFALAPGPRRVRVLFQRREAVDSSADAIRSRTPRASDDVDDDDTGTFAGRGRREIVERDRRARAAIPPLMVIDTVLQVAAGRVWLVTLDPERRTLTLLDEPSR